MNNKEMGLVMISSFANTFWIIEKIETTKICKYLTETYVDLEQGVKLDQIVEILLELHLN